MPISSRRRAIAFFVVLGVCLVLLAVGLNVGWIILNWREGVLLFLGVVFFALLIAGMIVNTSFLIREIRRNEQHDSFINAVTHELKTPISAIKMSARLLTDSRVGNLNTEQLELIKSISDDAERLLKITGELLNMSQVETGNIQLKLQATLPSVIIEQSMQAVASQAQQKNIQVQVAVQEKLPLIHADAEKTSWVLINFLTNAIKYSPEGTIIEVKAFTKNNSVMFTVLDHGKGIDEKYLPKIFDRYFKVPGTHERSGTGLGLAISKEFIEAQGGHIAVSSVPGEGSLFGFDFPTATTSQC